MEQVKNRRYDEALREEGRCHILVYGIAFCKKKCKVVVQERKRNEKENYQQISDSDYKMKKESISNTMEIIIQEI